MSEPTTELDSRFSDPDAVATGWDETRRALEAAEFFWISTVRRNGRPHVTPLVAVWLDDALHFCTGPAEQKAVNLRHNANVILTTGCNDWQGGLDVVVEGEAVCVTDHERLALLADAWARKWDGQCSQWQKVLFSTPTVARRWCSRSCRRESSPSARHLQPGAPRLLRGNRRAGEEPALLAD